jgi:hypothetical protein
VILAKVKALAGILAWCGFCATSVLLGFFLAHIVEPYSLGGPPDWVILGLVTVFVSSIVFSLARILMSERESNHKLQEQIERSQSHLPKHMARAWEISRATLEKFWNRNLSQNAAIFVLSLVAFLVGLFIMIWSVSSALANSNNVVVATVGAGAGILTELVGAIFLFVYKATMDQTIAYTQVLERINSIGMAWYAIEGIEGTDSLQVDLRNKAKAELISAIAEARIPDDHMAGTAGAD